MTKFPVARTAPHRMEHHGHVRVDDYYWLRERENPEVIAYLEAENTYTGVVMAHTEEAQEELFEEIKGRIVETDETVPYKLGDHDYYSRFEEGHEYRIYCRRDSLPSASPAPLRGNREQVMLDANVLAEGHDYFALRTMRVSPNQNLLAYAADTQGRRIYTIYVKDLTTGENLNDVITEVTGNLSWASDDKTLFYAKQDPQTLRSNRIYRHEIGTDPSRDVLVFEETDETFSTYVYRTKSKKYLVIGSVQTQTSEYRFLDVADPTGSFTVIEPRRRDHKYSVDHLGDFFYVRTNDKARNYRLMRTPVCAPGLESWEEIVAHREDVLLEDFDLFDDFLVVEERSDGLPRLRIRDWADGREHEVDFGEPAYHAEIGDNYETDSKLLRFEYTSLTTPNSVYDYDVRTREKTLLKRDVVLGGFDPANYRTERLHAKAHDGTEVPISLVYRRDKMQKNGKSPLLLTGYGSYGISREASFISPRLSLLDRGFAIAIAHIRGGEELGRAWYEDGKLLKKKNTFTDFIACAEHLVAEGYTSPGCLYAQGGSAGGLLMGAVVNMRPELFHGVEAAVPFVDVVTTMLDESIPLTTGEYDEWGDPRKKQYYDYILSYSPYDNVEAKDYPHLLVTTGIHDSQVQYWEPAKWVAKLRALKTDENRLLLKTELGAGHAGPSGRYERYRETAFLYTFLIDLAGLL